MESSTNFASYNEAFSQVIDWLDNFYPIHSFSDAQRVADAMILWEKDGYSVIHGEAHLFFHEICRALREPTERFLINLTGQNFMILSGKGDITIPHTGFAPWMMQPDNEEIYHREAFTTVCDRNYEGIVHDMPNPFPGVTYVVPAYLLPSLAGRDDVVSIGEVSPNNVVYSFIK